MSGKKKQEETGNQDCMLRDSAQDHFAWRPDVSMKMQSKNPEDLIQKLLIQQIELEMQNEELGRAHEDLKASQAKYANLYDLAPVGYFVLSEHRLILEANITAAVMLGVARGALTNQPLSIFILPDDHDIDYLHHKQLLETGTPHTCVIRMVRKDTTVFWARLEATVVQDTDGRRTCQAVMSDITERIQSEEALRIEIAERKTAEASLHAKNEELTTVTQQLWQTAKLVTMGELASSIAHELNNPLATVSLRIESLMTQTDKSDTRSRELEIIGHEVERMGKLVANLLQFSRRRPMQVSTTDVCEEIEKALELIHYHLRKFNIRLVREFAPAVPKVAADRQQLRQLFLNLLTNAADAMPRGGTLTIRVTAFTEKKTVCIEIADTGTGIPPEVLTHVMEQFYTTKPEGKGTGLGLCYLPAHH